MKNPRNVLKIANMNTKNLNTGLPSSYGLPKNKIVLTSGENVYEEDQRFRPKPLSRPATGLQMGI